MKNINVDEITKTVKNLCIKANCILNQDVRDAITNSLEIEESPVGRDVLHKLINNANVAKEKNMAICQDTGMAVVFVELGQDVHITGGSLEDAIQSGIRQGYKEGYLRKSVVGDPLLRKNTEDNTPAVIYYNIVNGDSLKLDIVPKGFGSENMSSVKMLKPSEGVKGVKAFVIDTVKKAGANPCPPIIVGVGIGGTMEKAALLAKKALTRPLDKPGFPEHISELEKELLDKINCLGIGPAGYGGRVTALGVNIEVFPTHIAGLPVAVNISCHATRHASAIL